MSLAEFEPAIPAIQRSKTRVLECAATGIGWEVLPELENALLNHLKPTSYVMHKQV